MVYAAKKVCPTCGTTFFSSEGNCVYCREEIGFEDSIKGKSKEELLEALKVSFAEDEKHNFMMLNMIFDLSKSLNSEFVVDALHSRLESKLEDGDIDEWMIEDAEMTMGLLNDMYISCFCGWAQR